MNRRELAKFQDPQVKEQYLERYGDPLEEVSPQDLMDLMENLWGSKKGSYAQLRDTLTRKGVDTWTGRQDLAEAYFRNLYIREHELDEQTDKSKIEDVSDFIRARIQEHIKAFQEREAQESQNVRMPFRS